MKLKTSDPLLMLAPYLRRGRIVRGSNAGFTLPSFFSKNLGGFTLVEIIVVVGIMIILMTLAVPTYRLFQSESGLDNIAEKIVNNLRLARSKTLASEGASQYGVYFSATTTPHQFTLFKGEDYAGRDNTFDQINQLPESVEIYEINLTSGAEEIVFNRIVGDTAQAGNLRLRLIGNPSETRTIYVENSGQASLSPLSAPSDGRTADSRHVHFDLGWSIKDASTLRFYFPDILQTEEVDMTNYFDAVPPTEFDWQGTFSIEGTDQEFQVHTHLLNASNTTLCIHRNRNQGKNDQKVIISIVDGAVNKNIAHYSADAEDKVAAGLYGGTKEVQ